VRTDANPIVAEQLHAVAAAIDEDVRMMGARFAEYTNHSRQRRFVPARISSGSTASHTALIRITAAARAATKRRPLRPRAAS
jgi:hypothetical protein